MANDELRNLFLATKLSFKGSYPDLAQLAERLTVNQDVASSSLAVGAIYGCVCKLAKAIGL